MKKQGLVSLVLLTIVTFGIYSIFWFARTRGEMVRSGADVPTTWLIIIPIANIYYLYKYCMGVEKVTNGKLNGILAFILVWLVGIVGQVIIQLEFNNVAESGAIPAEAAAPVAPATPSNDGDTTTPAAA